MQWRQKWSTVNFVEQKLIYIYCELNKHTFTNFFNLRQAAYICGFY